eukprot:233130-Rhodomonas_salina.1
MHSAAFLAGRASISRARASVFGGADVRFRRRGSLETKNVLIECTATDPMRAKIVLDTVVAMFSQYCTEPFTCEDLLVVGHD